MAGKAPGPRRLDEADLRELDDIPPVTLEDVVGGCLQIRRCNVHRCLQDDVLLTMWPMMSMDLSKLNLLIREDLHDEGRLSVMCSALSKMPSEKMKMDVIVVVDGVESSAGRPRTDEPALLPCEIKVGSSEFLRGGFLFRDVLKSLRQVSLVRHW